VVFCLIVSIKTYTIVELSNTIGDICIFSTSYNVSCYGDDVLLISCIIAGLQRLINVADKYISSQGLRFNPKKTHIVLHLLVKLILLKSLNGL